MTGVLMGRWEFGQRHREQTANVKKEAETEVMLPQGREHLGLPKAGRGTEHPPLEALEGAGPCQHLDPELLASRTMER